MIDGEALVQIFVDRTPSLENYIRYFETFNYVITANPNYEENFEKIAIYTNENEKDKVTHASKQYKNMWRSKLGSNIIIEHELSWLEGYDADNYGYVKIIMKKKI